MEKQKSPPLCPSFLFLVFSVAGFRLLYCFASSKSIQPYKNPNLFKSPSHLSLAWDRLRISKGEATMCRVEGEESPVSGGGVSQNGKFSYGYASSPGKRSSMEDFYETRIDAVGGEVVGLFGVFDGHGGARAAEYVKQNLFSNLIQHPKFISDTKSAIADAYNHTDSEFLKSENSQNRDAGSTASTAILVGDRLLVANVGDSRAVICRGGNAIPVSRDHKPDQTDERQRIEDAGGFVMWAGTWRVGGVLAVSRAFGDRLLKQYVVADPEIQEEVIDKSLEFLILASDGLWDVVTNEEAVSMIKSIQNPEEAAKRLLQEACQRGSADNITCVVQQELLQMSPSLERHSLRMMSSSSPNPTARTSKGKSCFQEVEQAGQIRVLSALREVVSLTSIGRQMDVKAKNYYRLLGPHQLAV
ncbi:hypothetical protein MRB53_013241 [Persea americana]|uniref:Uncharacterized protein n=1 Tax=Persea americana TaxID=3435 RepID=A0ACC2K7H5_PERAE|nr:hypothetical protein MRB53_013241 [Persea americana]